MSLKEINAEGSTSWTLACLTRFLNSSSCSGCPIIILAFFNSLIHVSQVHPPTLRICTVTADQYFKDPFTAILRSADLAEFTLLHVDERGTLEAEVRAAEDDSGLEDKLGAHADVLPGCDVEVTRRLECPGIRSRTHLRGPRLGTVGDSVLGYDLEASNLSKLNSVRLICLFIGNISSLFTFLLLTVDLLPLKAHSRSVV